MTAKKDFSGGGKDPNGEPRLGSAAIPGKNQRGEGAWMCSLCPEVGRGYVVECRKASRLHRFSIK